MRFGAFVRKLNEKERVSRDTTLVVEGEILPVSVRELAEAKRITLRLLPSGNGLKVTMPPHVSDGELDAFLNRNTAWVVARRARLPESIRIEAGGVLPFLGIDHRIVPLNRTRGVVEIEEIAGVPSLMVPGDPEFIERKIVSFFKKEARARLSEATSRHAAAIGVRPRQIRITDTTSRWGSCSSTRTLSFSWRIVMAPPEVLDYLAAHEVAHLREMNHSARFWAIVRDICPEMERHKAWLRSNGTRLHAVNIA